MCVCVFSGQRWDCTGSHVHHIFVSIPLGLNLHIASTCPPSRQSMLRTLIRVPQGLWVRVWDVQAQRGVLAKWHPCNVIECCQGGLHVPSQLCARASLHRLARTIVNFQEFYKPVIQNSHYQKLNFIVFI